MGQDMKRGSYSGKCVDGALCLDWEFLSQCHRSFGQIRENRLYSFNELAATLVLGSVDYLELR